MAGRIPQPFIDELLSRTDIVELIDARVPLKKAGHEYKACCPFHNENTPSFTVSQTKQFYHCFGCGAHGTALAFLMEYDHLEFREAVEELAQRAGLQVPIDETAAPQQNHQPLYDILDEVNRWYQQQLRKHPQRETAIDYLKQRGLSGAIAADFGLGFAPPGWDNVVRALGTTPERRTLLDRAGLTSEKNGNLRDRLRERIIFPIHDSRGRVIGFGGRIMGQGEPKYLNSPETPVFHKGRELYGLYLAKQHTRKLEALLVVEGYMDVVALAQHGVRNAVATLGTATTAEHLQRLFRTVSKVIFCFDGDRAGRAAAWKALETTLPQLRDGLQVSFLFLPEGEDPDSFIRAQGQAAFEAEVARAKPLSDFFFEHLFDEEHTHSLDGRARAAERAKPLLNQLPAGIFRETMLERLGKEVGLDPSRLRQGLGLDTPARNPKQREARAQAGQARRTTPNLLRHTLRILLDQPDLALQLDDWTWLQDEAERQAEDRALQFFVEVVGFFREQPGRTLAHLSEYWREQPQATAALERLLSHPLPALQSGHGKEFLDGWARLRKSLAEARLDDLIARSRSGNLSADERAELAERLQQRAV
jgi:DNA primase